MKFYKALIVGSLLVSATAFADGYYFGNKYSKARDYAVTITNITSGQSFTPVIVATHTSAVNFFELGTAPSQDLADLAEGGDTSGLQMTLDSMTGDVMATVTSGITPDGNPLIDPGESVTIMISGSRKFDRLSLAGMLLPTNDSFVAVDSMSLPYRSSESLALAYDAGSEQNDELCASIPGPHCGGEPFSAGFAEGYVHISRGISGAGDLTASDYDWRNPVARITVVRVK
jgi:hypothetical protein